MENTGIPNTIYLLNFAITINDPINTFSKHKRE